MRKISNLVNDKLSSCRVHCWNEKLREGELLRRNPLVSLPELPLLSVWIDIVVKESLLFN